MHDERKKKGETVSNQKSCGKLGEQDARKALQQLAERHNLFG